LDVAADIADLGELGGLDLDERRAGQFREPPRDLGLADPGRSDHQDILRQHLLAKPAIELLPSPAVAERDGNGALGVGLADDEAIEFGYDFAGGEVCHGALARIGTLSGQARTLSHTASEGRGRPGCLPRDRVQIPPSHRPGWPGGWRDPDRSPREGFG